jgi:hypothetical protein
MNFERPPGSEMSGGAGSLMCARRERPSHRRAAEKRDDFAPLLDHLVGGNQQRRRHDQAECPGGVEVDGEIEPGGLHDRQIGRLGAFENSPDVVADYAKLVLPRGRVAYETSRSDGSTIGVNRRNCVLTR